MLEVNLMKDRVWPAAGAAFVMHSLVISAFAFGLVGQKGTAPQDFHVEMMFESNLEKGKSKEIISPSKNQLSTPYPSPATALSARVDLSHKGRGVQQPSFSPLSSGGEQSSSGNQGAIPLYNPPPIYPREARLRKIEGVVLVEISLSETGSVANAKLLLPRIHPLLEEAALKAIRQWRFKPGVQILEVPIEFKLDA